LTRVRLFVLTALAVSAAWAADVCPRGTGAQGGGTSGIYEWISYSAEIRPQKYCVANEVGNKSAAPLTVSWPEAGIEKASVRGQLQIAECCFDGVEDRKATLQEGEPPRSRQVQMRHAAEEGLAQHEEGYPDLIEEEARVRLASIRGTLAAGGREVRVDVVLKCSASQFAKQFAYQYSITDRSLDPIEVDWSLLSGMRSLMTPSVQTIPKGKTYIFLSGKEPREAEGRVELRTKSGASAGIFRLEGFAAN